MFLDYSSKTTLTNLASASVFEGAYDALFFDCEIADCGMMPRTFWVSATTSVAQSRCYLEKLAIEIFHHHVPSSGYHYDPNTSGAEWWVQIRPSPPVTGRYSMLSDGNDDDDGYDKDGMSFHWDKDEELCKMSDGSMYVHPHISTVTYLTDLGGPTVVLSKRVETTTGRYVTEIDNDVVDGNATTPVEGYVSWPRQGKHLSFDGRMLHGAPSDMMIEGMFERQTTMVCDKDEANNEKKAKILARRRRRVTFLVNIWLNYRPYGVNPFPDGMVGNLSTCDLFGDDFVLFYDKDNFNACVNDGDPMITNVMSHGGKASMVKSRTPSTCESDDGSQKFDPCHDGIQLTKMIWTMGGGKEDGYIEALIPLELIRDKGETGSDVAITWIDGFVISASGIPNHV